MKIKFFFIWFLLSLKYQQNPKAFTKINLNWEFKEPKQGAQILTVSTEGFEKVFSNRSMVSSEEGIE